MRLNKKKSTGHASEFVTRLRECSFRPTLRLHFLEKKGISRVHSWKPGITHFLSEALMKYSQLKKIMDHASEDVTRNVNAVFDQLLCPNKAIRSLDKAKKYHCTEC
jgi:hypothetical protein